MSSNTVTGVHRRGRNRRVPSGHTGPQRPLKGRAWRRLLGGLVTLGALTGGALGVHFGWQALSNSPRLQVRAVEVRGNQRVRSHEVLAYTNIAPGDSILRTDLDAAALGLRRHPWIDRVRLQRQLPDRVVVDVEENQPAIVVALGDLYLVNQRGEPFKRLTAGDAVVGPVVTGLNRQAMTDDPRSVASRLVEAIALGGALREEGNPLGRLEELHWDDDLGWSAVTRPDWGGEPLVIHLGRQARERLPLALATLGQVIARQQTPRVIWVDGAKYPGRTHVRTHHEVNSNDFNPLIAKAR